MIIETSNDRHFLAIKTGIIIVMKLDSLLLQTQFLNGKTLITYKPWQKIMTDQIIVCDVLCIFIDKKFQKFDSLYYEFCLFHWTKI